ncbi:MAG: glycerophosphodiester phosphodiesterase, partial [Gammaproteobacteria bacterium]|nr:glycerophosphodiester phosphodiesterase [Gammaproteobacteria bacterium]
TLPGFARALTIGVDVLELDAAVTADGVVVVSHDPQLDPVLTRGPNGQWIDDHGLLISRMNFEDLRRYDVGRINPASSYAGQFSGQVPADGARIPSLQEVAALVTKAGNREVRFNVETKVRPDRPELTLEPEAFADRLVAALREAGIAERATVQSFYWRTLDRVRAVAPEIVTVCLTSERDWLNNIARGRGRSPWTGLDVDAFGGSVPRLVHASGCAVWSPHHLEVNRALIDEAHHLGLKVIVWTVNAPEDMASLISLGVDGIITDYPDRLRALLQSRGIPVPPPTPVSAD